jgi:molybdopterin synthase sulfur carrier subunit
MKVRVRYFASLREALGTGEDADVNEGSTVGQLRDALIARGAVHASALARGRAIRTALNHVLCDESTLLHEGSELAFFPPVTGG